MVHAPTRERGAAAEDHVDVQRLCKTGPALTRGKTQWSVGKVGPEPRAGRQHSGAGPALHCQEVVYVQGWEEERWVGGELALGS